MSNDEIHDIIKIIKSLEDSGLLIKGKGVFRASEGVLRAGYGRCSFFALQNNNNNKMDF